ncbi:ATP-binding protein [Rhizobium gallicum]|uniref:ATP-binding protein n=1 Tax=Rhizobium gallicum TaxID=56730 RepID=UPI0003716423
MDKTNVVTKSFTTRARTIDHLGREQIADCPTAVSELWKNSWDAYARCVKLHVFNEEAPVAVLHDDGHGMRSVDLFERWLVIGTENKLSDIQPTAAADRNGLPVRPRQGQKGIGRLSSAKLGSVLLLITKHRADDFVVALIDWRMFENPFVNLSEVAVATGSYASKADIFAALPALADQLIGSVLADTADWRTVDRLVRDAWRHFDQEWLKENPLRAGLPPSSRIVQSIKRLPFRIEHLDNWDGPGTAMMVFDLDDTLKALPVNGDTDLIRTEIVTRFEQTLSNFVDPYSSGRNRPEFDYSVDVRTTDANGSRPKLLVGAERAIDRFQVQDMEHQIEGTVGDDGVFRGRLKAFGVWIDSTVEFSLPKGLYMPERAATRVGPFDIYIASMEFDPNNSTHNRADHVRYLGLAEEFSGLMIYRDGLRVLPYGREDNDFFEIEYKRSKNAGRYFWNHRQMFGRISLTRQHNPNLKDKAGREGFIDNTAAKTFRAIVGNILDQSARRYFGSASEIRKPRINEIKANNREGRAEEEAKKLRERERKLFQAEVERAEQQLPSLASEIERELRGFSLQVDDDVVAAAGRLSAWRGSLADTAIRPQPSGSAKLASRYQAARNKADAVSELISSYETKFRDAVTQHQAGDPSRLLNKQIKQATEAIRQQIDQFQSSIVALQREQYDFVRVLAQSRISEFGKDAEAIPAKVEAKLLDIGQGIDALVRLQDEWIDENRRAFGIYISTLESVKERIDLETLASVQNQSLREATAELDRLTALAQLGIAVEIAAHDLQEFDEMATMGLNALPDDLRDTPAVRDIRLGLEGLTDQLRFLSPLRLSGDRIQRWITGAEIAEFIRQFFAPKLAEAGIAFAASDEFLALRLYERPARIFPVFMNLVNNSVYWVATVPRATRKITLEVEGDEVAVVDSGPGVSEEDQGQIFRLFFTRKERSGRGVGLYLARANLSSGGHSIRYRTAQDVPSLPGAAFYIKFKDADLGPQGE